MSKLPLSEKEIKIQMALGSLPQEMKIAPCRYKEPEISKGRRKCTLCGEKCIKKGNLFYLINMSDEPYPLINICMDCAWLSKQKINRIIQDGKEILGQEKKQ